MKYTASATANFGQPVVVLRQRVAGAKGIGYGKAAHGTVSQVLLCAAREVKEAGVGSMYS
jgi:hypothetical protein